ncbi:MAG: peptidoglycan DD-metalloendopeptidase family protein [Patescibacteria group bacterium]
MYPISILKHGTDIHPLFGDTLAGEPHIFDFSSANPNIGDYNTLDYDAFQSAIACELKRNKKQWGVGRYLEERATLLRHYPQMVREGRVYHAGLDVTGLPGTALHAPLDAVVFEAGFEAGQGNYGGYVILKHAEPEPFYSMYGHLSTNHAVKAGDVLHKGQVFAALGEGRDAGGWFAHVHLQIHTEKSFREGHAFQGYADAEMLKYIESIFPSPYLLFRY